MPLPLPIALDAMGGDNAPASVIGGAYLALERYPGLRFIFFGDRAKLEPLLASYSDLRAQSEIFHTDAIVSAHDKPSVAVRQGKNTSMRLAIDAVKDGKAIGVVSAGNTGALMALAKIVLKTLPGIYRPAIAALLPTLQGESVMLDLGANVECDASDLFQFAVMGDAFARAVLGLSRPRIGVLNVGSEEMKGHDEVRAVSALLKDHQPLNFCGFVEGNDIAEGTADVIVTDGFSGNIALKTAEGTAKMISAALRASLTSSFSNRLGALFARTAFASVREKLDPRKHNGAMFLGLNGIVIKSHGSADAFSFSNAIGVATELATHKINQKIIEEVRLASRVASEAEAAAQCVVP